jgi:hypothetical protein
MQTRYIHAAIIKMHDVINDTCQFPSFLFELQDIYTVYGYVSKCSVWMFNCVPEVAHSRYDLLLASPCTVPIRGVVYQVGVISR